jgi:undecaprenyl-diphosphatase
MSSKQQIQIKAKGISFRLLIIIGLLLLTLLVFWSIADEIVLEHESNFDLFIFQKLSFLSSPFTTKLMLFFTFFGSNIFLLPAYILLTAYFLFYKKNTRVSLNIIAIGISSTALLFLIKDIFKRHRPLDPLVQNVTGFSFPSGHSFSAFTFFGLLIYILWQTHITQMWKYLLSIVFILFASGIAFSRVYLHVHYPSDVIAGFCLSMLWLNISLWILHKINLRHNLQR